MHARGWVEGAREHRQSEPVPGVQLVEASRKILGLGHRCDVRISQLLGELKRAGNGVIRRAINMLVRCER